MTGRALEFAIGTGRVAIPLAERGVPVTGIELSRPMIEQLRVKAGETAIPVIAGDMATAQAPGGYTLVYLVFNTISNLLTQGEQVACFRNAARHLTPGGRFVIELWVPELRKLPPGQQAIVFSSEPGYIGLDTYDVLHQQVVSHHFSFGAGSRPGCSAARTATSGRRTGPDGTARRVRTGSAVRRLGRERVHRRVPFARLGLPPKNRRQKLKGQRLRRPGPGKTSAAALSMITKKNLLMRAIFFRDHEISGLGPPAAPPRVGRPGGPGKDFSAASPAGRERHSKSGQGAGSFKIVGRFRRISPKTTHDHGGSPFRTPLAIGEDDAGTLAVQPPVSVLFWGILPRNNATSASYERRWSAGGRHPRQPLAHTGRHGRRLGGRRTRRAKAALINTRGAERGARGGLPVRRPQQLRGRPQGRAGLGRDRPGIAAIPPAVRGFQQRVLRFLVIEAGIRQFLDIGTGLPLVGATHEVAQSLAPESRIAYVDNDPMVLAHARAMMTSAPGGAIGFVDADMRDTAAIVAGARATLDFGLPVAVLLLFTLSYVADAAEAAAVVPRWWRRCRPAATPRSTTWRATWTRCWRRRPGSGTR